MLYDNIDVITRARRCTYSNDRCGGIMSHLVQIDKDKEGSTAPFINNLEIIEVFKDEMKRRRRVL